MPERSKGSHSRCDVATLEGSNPSLCIFIFKYFFTRYSCNNNNGHIPTPRRLPTPHGHALASPEDLG